MIGRIYFIIAQLQLEGLEQAANQSVLDAVLVSIIVILFGLLGYIFKLYLDKAKDLKSANDVNHKRVFDIQNSHASKLEELNKDHVENIDDIIKDSQRMENERLEKSLASEKEMINVLNGVNQINKIGDKIRQTENNRLIDKLNDINQKVDELRKK